MYVCTYIGIHVYTYILVLSLSLSIYIYICIYMKKVCLLGMGAFQDMYDALVLALPPEAAAPNVFFTEPHSEVWCRPD